MVVSFRGWRASGNDEERWERTGSDGRGGKGTNDEGGRLGRLFEEAAKSWASHWSGSRDIISAVFTILANAFTQRLPGFVRQLAPSDQGIEAVRAGNSGRTPFAPAAGLGTHSRQG